MPNLACRWLDTHRWDGPFFLRVGIPGPHPPYNSTPDVLALYDGRELPAPIGDQADFDSQPAALKRLCAQHLSTGHDAMVHLADPTTGQTRRQRQHDFANVTMIDTQVGHMMEARSLVPYLDGTQVEAREYVFSEHASDLIGTEFMTMIRGRRWKLAHFVDHADGQLFDLDADPQELRNLWDDPAHAATRPALINEILARRIRNGLHTQGWVEALDGQKRP